MEAIEERRNRTRNSSAALDKVHNTNRIVRLLSIVLACYLAVVVTAACVIGTINSFRAVAYSQQALAQAKVNGDISKLIRDCVEATPPGKKPTKCVSDGEARTGAAVAAIVDADGNGELDTVEIRQALERIERAIR